MAGAGAGRLVGSGLPGAVAAIAAVWNPFVAERLLMGQWALLVGYAAIPWVVRGLARRLDGRGSWRALAVALCLGALGGAAAMVLVALVLVGGLAASLAGPDRRDRIGRLAGPVLLHLVLALPWLVPSVLRDRPGSDPTGFAAFAPAADTVGGVVVSVLTGGGVWNAEAVPPGRTGFAAAAGGLAIVVLAIVGLARPGRRTESIAGRSELVVLGWAAAAGLLCVWVSSQSWAGQLAGVPGGGLLRDGARQLGAWCVLLAVGLGLFVRAAAARGVPVVAPALGLLPVATLPLLGWGVGGSLHTVTLPGDVQTVTHMVNTGQPRGAVAVVPFAAYRAYPWNDGRPSLTPWTRLLEVPTAVSSDLVVRTGTSAVEVKGEDAWTARVGAALASDRPADRLTALGVRWVIVDDGAGLPPPGSELVFRGRDVGLYRLPGEVDASRGADGTPPAAPVIAADLTTLLGAGWLVGRAGRRAREGDGAPPTMR
jgi:hypothetical protein